MKSGSTNTVTEAIIYDAANAPVSRPVIKTEYYSDTSGTWVEFDNDLESRTISFSSENLRYGNYSFMPPAKTLQMTLNNFNQVYSTGSGNAKASILKKNLLVRCWSGYELTANTDVAPQVHDFWDGPGEKWGSGFYWGIGTWGTGAVWGISGTTARWGATGSPSSTNVEFFKRGTFVLDEPEYAQKVNITGRDYTKKLLETEISLPNLHASAVTTVIARVLDRASVPYSTADWDLVATTINLDASGSQFISGKSAWKTIDLLMDAVNAGDDEIKADFDGDGNFLVNKIPTDNEADINIHYKFNIESISKSFDSDKQLQRLTVSNKTLQGTRERLIGSFTGTTGGSTALHITYPTLGYYDGNGQFTSAVTSTPTKSSVFVRYVDNNNIISAETSRTNTAIDFTVPASTAYDIDVYGDVVSNNARGLIYAERGNSDNIKANDGQTFQKVNPFMSVAMQKAYVDFTVGKFGDPAKKVQLAQRCNPLIEIGDQAIVFDRYTYTDALYRITQITENWSNPGLSEEYILIDSGTTVGDFVWDRNGANAGINDLKYDTGLVWDLDFGPDATEDTTDYSSTKEIQFS